MPARKPRTECCCQSVTFIIAAIVAPLGVRSIATIRACLVLDPVFGFGDAAGERLREPALAVFRVERAAAFGPDFSLVMESSEVLRDAIRRTTSALPGKTPGRAGPEGVLSAPNVTHSNAPFPLEIQSILSKIVARRADGALCPMIA